MKLKQQVRSVFYVLISLSVALALVGQLHSTAPTINASTDHTFAANPSSHPTSQSAAKSRKTAPLEGCTPPSWCVVDSPPSDTSVRTLTGVATVSDSEAWSVGASYDQRWGLYGSVIYHWDGTSWADVPEYYENSGLNAVAATSSNDAWAAGFVNAGHTFMMHWDGGVWSQVTTP